MRVFLYCIAHMATGGTELIHQFARCLMDKGVEVYIVYMQKNPTRNPTPVSFEKYGVKYVTDYVDAKDSVLVLAETQVQMLALCKLGKAVIWWMSVDNYLAYRAKFGGSGVDYFELRQKRMFGIYVNQNIQDVLLKENSE